MIESTEPLSTAFVLLVEDNPSLAKAVVRTIERAGLKVKLAGNFAEALTLIERSDLRFDAAILDHQLPDGDSRDLVHALTQRTPFCSALILTGHRDHTLALEYRGRGAFRFAAKPIGGIQLLANIHATMLDSHRWRGAGTDDAQLPKEPPVVVVDVEQAADRLRYIASLSPTEREVAYWVLQGLRDAQIAQLLGRAERTAKRHVGQVLAKAGVQNRASLWALLRTDGNGGIISPADSSPSIDGSPPSAKEHRNDDGNATANLPLDPAVLPIPHS